VAFFPPWKVVEATGWMIKGTAKAAETEARITRALVNIFARISKRVDEL